MRFEEAWEQYDFTESEIMSMSWEIPLNYVLKVNYYWNLTSENQPGQGATRISHKLNSRPNLEHESKRFFLINKISDISTQLEA